MLFLFSQCSSNGHAGQLIEDSKAPKNISLASFKPTVILNFEIEADERVWKKACKEQLNQLSISFSNKLETLKQKEWIAKIPYKFYYRFKDVEGRASRLMRSIQYCRWLID